jgi:hypothetical protein
MVVRSSASAAIRRATTTPSACGSRRRRHGGDRDLLASPDVLVPLAVGNGVFASVAGSNGLAVTIGAC